MTHYVKSLATGRIVGIYTDPDDIVIVPTVDGLDMSTHHVAEGAVIPRPDHPDLPEATVAVGVPLAGFPAGWPARLLLDGAVQAEGEIPASGALVFGDPGAWTVELPEAWALGPHRPRVYAVTVTEPEA